MRKALLLMLIMTMTIVAAAADITPDAARQMATQFVQKQVKSGQAFRRSSANPQLTMASKQDCLYVFNVDEGNGYVIVSGDDRTEAILGYSNSGTFDPQHIPSNMRAWLQGYADEIAWVKEHGGKAAPVMAARRSIKQAIAPMVDTHWNQDEPYNNLCPYYGVDEYGYLIYSTTGGSGWEHCATGCVATAMAQVMKYHEWPKSATAAIPLYKWDSAGINLLQLSATTFDWDNMLNDYGSAYDSGEANAIATLMKYCGYSVKMDYGPESGSNTDLVAAALTAYYDYNSTTTFVQRTHYSYNKWIDLLYNELSQGRPIVYGGRSSGGGHEFVCDGYQGEDYFHINWGWGGTSDDYFKLSALNPYEQGIGGSSSKDGYHYSQDAVIGIQPSTGTGTVLDVSTNQVNLSLISFTLSTNTIALGESVEATVTLKNNSSDEYDGDILIYANGYGSLSGKTFLIAPDETKELVITVTPTDIGTYELCPIYGDYSNYILPKKTETLTVTEASSGSTNPTTGNITLGRSLSVENTEVISGNNYNVYGKTFNGTLTVSNPDMSYDYKEVYQCDLYDNSYELVTRFVQEIRVPANGSITIPIKYSGMEYGETYHLYVTYYKIGSWSSWDKVGSYTAQPAAISYASDGTETVEKLSETTFNVPASALAVDLSDLGVTTVTANSEANCMFILGSADTTPDGASNIIRYNGTDYTAESITLKDNKAFYSPVDFTAGKVEFTYDFTVAADGTNGWNTIMLPFDVTKVTADDVEKDWFHNADDTGKNFWLKEFTGDEGNTVNFDHANELKANIPYIVAFPGGAWGKKWDMSNKVIKFIGEGVTVHKSGSMTSVTGENYRFVGSTVQDNTSNIYVLNADGNQFVSGTTGSAPFRAYFKPGIYDRTVSSLTIGSKPADGTTGIQNLNVNENENEDDNYYNLNGQRVNQPAKGIYIHHGRKEIIK